MCFCSFVFEFLSLILFFLYCLIKGNNVLFKNFLIFGNFWFKNIVVINDLKILVLIFFELSILVVIMLFESIKKFLSLSKLVIWLSELVYINFDFINVSCFWFLFLKELKSIVDI